MIQCLIDTTQNTCSLSAVHSGAIRSSFSRLGEPFDYSFWRKHLQLAAYQPDIFVTGQGTVLFLRYSVSIECPGARGACGSSRLPASIGRDRRRIPASSVCFSGQPVDQMDTDANAADFQGFISFHKFLQVIAAVDDAGCALVDRLQSQFDREQRTLV